MHMDNECCPNCHRFIDQDRFHIHLLMCSSRQLRRSRCSNISNQKHCIFCMERYQQEQLENHMSNCEHRLVSCNNCQDMFPLSLFQEHEQVCKGKNRNEQSSTPSGKENSSIFNSQISKSLIKGASFIGMKLFEKGKKAKAYAQQFYEENLEEKVHEIRETYYKKQDKLFQMLETAISPLANQQNIDGMPRYKIRQLETTLYRKTQKMQQEETCSICCVEYDQNEPIKKLKCGHFYHPQCIMQWLQINRTCPVCRRDQMEN